MSELSSKLKKTGHELSEAHRKVEDMRQTLDCSWSLLQKYSGTSGAALVSELDRECKLSTKAHLLLAVNDEAAVERKSSSSSSTPAANVPVVTSSSNRHRHSHHVSNNDRQHWLLG